MAIPEQIAITKTKKNSLFRVLAMNSKIGFVTNRLRNRMKPTMPIAFRIINKTCFPKSPKSPPKIGKINIIGTTAKSWKIKTDKLAFPSFVDKSPLFKRVFKTIAVLESEVKKPPKTAIPQLKLNESKRAVMPTVKAT